MIIIAGDLSPNHWGLCIGKISSAKPEIITTSSIDKNHAKILSFREKTKLHINFLAGKIREISDTEDEQILFIIEDAFIGRVASSAIEILKMHGVIEYLFTGPKTKVQRFIKISKATWSAGVTEKTQKTDKINIASLMSLKYNYPVVTEHEGDALGIWTFFRKMKSVLTNDNSEIFREINPNQMQIIVRFILNNTIESGSDHIRHAKTPKDAYEIINTGEIVRPKMFSKLFTDKKYDSIATQTRNVILSY